MTVSVNLSFLPHQDLLLNNTYTCQGESRGNFFFPVCYRLAILPANYPSVGITNESGIASLLSFLTSMARRF